MPNKKEDSDTEETSERPSGSESDDDTDPEDHKGAAKKQQATASSSEESDISDAESDEEPTQKKTESKKSSDSKEASNISLKKANEPSDNAPAKKSGKKSSKKDVKNEKQDEKKVTIAESSGSKSTSKGFGVRESFGTLREKRKSKKAREAKDKEGIIQKKGNINRKWEKKYIIVSSASRTIYLYDLEPEQNERRANQAPKQVISLETAVIYARVQRRGAEMQSYFNIRANNRDYLFKAASPEEKSEWVAAIKSNKKKKEEDQVPIKGAGFQTPESQKKQDKNIEKASNIFLKLFGRESYLGVAKDS